MNNKEKESRWYNKHFATWFPMKIKTMIFVIVFAVLFKLANDYLFT